MIGPALIIVHPLPQHEDQRARNDRRNEQDHAVNRGEALVRRPGRRGSREASGRMIVPGRNMIVNRAARHEARPHQRVVKRLRVIVEPDPLRRLVRQELEVGEAHPQNAEDRPDLVADEKYERWRRETATPPCPSAEHGDAAAARRRAPSSTSSVMRSPAPCHRIQPRSQLRRCAAGLRDAGRRLQPPRPSGDQPFLISACDRLHDLLHRDLRIGFLALEVGLPDRLADDELLEPKRLLLIALARSSWPRTRPTKGGIQSGLLASQPA